MPRRINAGWLIECKDKSDFRKISFKNKLNIEDENRKKKHECPDIV